MTNPKAAEPMVLTGTGAGEAELRFGRIGLARGPQWSDDQRRVECHPRIAIRAARRSTLSENLDHMGPARVAAVTMLVRADDHWSLPVDGQMVAQLCIDYAVTLRLGNEVAVRIEQPFVLVIDGDERLVVPDGGLDGLAPVLSLARSPVIRGAAFDDGHLELSFGDRTRLSVQAAEDYEPWAGGGAGWSACRFRPRRQTVDLAAEHVI